MHLKSGWNCLGIGDELPITTLVREFKFHNPNEIISLDIHYPELFYNNPHLAGTIDSGDTVDLFHDYFNFTYSYAKLLGIKIYNSEPEIFLTESEIQSFLQLPNTVSVETRAGWPIRVWDFKNFVKLVDMLHDHGFRVVQVGKCTSKDSSTWCGLSFPEVDMSVVSLPNVDESYLNQLSIRETASVIKSCRLHIGSDSGLNSLATAVKTKDIRLFFRTSVAIGLSYRTTYAITPFNNTCSQELWWLWHAVGCEVCHTALNSITPEDVISVIERNNL
jgi:ADP-heptose:LPS heptosyltransferase